MLSFLCICFETESHGSQADLNSNVCKDNLVFLVLLAPLLKCWYYRGMVSHPIYVGLGLNPQLPTQ